VSLKPEKIGEGIFVTLQEKIEKNKAIWNQVSWDDMKNYIGPHAESYKNVFDKHKKAIEGTSRSPYFGMSWSWAACVPILGIPWAVARKQWVFVGMMVAVVVFVNVVSAFLPSASFGFLLFMAPIMAKNFYVQNAVVKIAKIKDRVSDQQSCDEEIRNAGGLNLMHGVMAAAVCAVFLIFNTVSLLSSLE
jgi:hypothetical protein